MIQELILRTFKARDFAHLKHLTTKSYAQHMALGAFYDAIIPAMDALVESWMGLGNPSVEDFPLAFGKMKSDVDIAEYLQEEADWLEENRDELSGGNNAIGNQVDTMTGIYLSCIYKLENLS